MKDSVLLEVCYCLLVVTVLTGTGSVQAKKRGTRESPPPITTMAPAPITTNRLTISPATTTSRTTQEYTQSELTNPNQTAIHKVRNESNSTLSTTLQQTESFPSSAFSQRDRVTLVMGVVGGVVGLLLLIVIIVCSILLCIAASSYHKIKTASGQNNIEHGNKKPDIESRGSKGEGHIYHVLEQTPRQPQAIIRHSYEIVDRETEDNSSAGEVSLATTTTSCNSHTSHTTTQKNRDSKHDYDEVIPTSRSRLSNYDHLGELETTKPWRHSLNEQGSRRLSFSPVSKSEYDTLQKGRAQTEKRKSEYSSLDETVHGYAVLRPHSSCTTPTTETTPTARTSTTQDEQYSHLIHR